MDGTVYAFDAPTGNLLFTHRDSRPAVHSWAAPGHPEYVPTIDGLLYRIDPNTDEAHVVVGKFISRNEPSTLSYALPGAINPPSDAVVLTNEQSSVLFIDLRAGRVIRETSFTDTAPTPDPILPTLSGPIVVVQRTAVGIRVLETATGVELANASLVHTEPRFWHRGRCLNPPNPAADQFVAYMTDARDTITVRNIRTGEIAWTKAVSAAVVEAHGLGGVRVASRRDADMLVAARAALPHAPLALPRPPPLTPVPPSGAKDLVVATDGRHFYPVLAPRDGATDLSTIPRKARKNIRRYPLAKGTDPVSLEDNDRVLARPRKSIAGDLKNVQNIHPPRDAALVYIVIIFVGVIGYLAGSRPRYEPMEGNFSRVGNRRRPRSTGVDAFDEFIDYNINQDKADGEGNAGATPAGLQRANLLQNQPHESSTGSTGSAGGFISNRSESGWMTVGSLRVSSKVLGVGSHGTIVYEGKMMPGERKVAVKRLLRQFFESARKEISLLIELDEESPHVVRYFAMEEDSEFIYLALELCTGSLAEAITQKLPPVPPLSYNGGPPPTYTSRALRQLLQGLADLHRAGVVHRDIKPQNVLIGRASTGVGDVKLADVGLALRLQENRSSYTAVTAGGGGVGTTGWRAPEVLSGGRQTKAVDIFAVGCVVSSMLTGGSHPFGNATFGRDGNIAAGNPNLEALEALNVPEATDIVRKMIDPVGSARPTAEDALNHPFFWTDATKLSFLIDISDRLYDLRHNAVRYTENLDRHAPARKHCSDWRILLDLDLLHSLGRDYENTASGLIRVMRNKRNHYSELSSTIRRKLGPLPKDTSGSNDSSDSGRDSSDSVQESRNFLTYFTSKVPHLLMVVYNYALANPALTDQPHFSRYGLKPSPESSRPVHSILDRLRGGRSEIALRPGGSLGRLTRPDVFRNVADDLREKPANGERRIYTREEMIEVQKLNGDVRPQVRRRIINSEIYQPSAFQRNTKRLTTNLFEESDFDNEITPAAGDTAVGTNAAPLASSPGRADVDDIPPGFQRISNRRGVGHGPPGFAQRHGNLSASPSPSRVHHLHGNRRDNGNAPAPTISQFSGEERVVDFGTLRRRNV